VINIFVAQGPGPADHDAKLETMQGFNIQRWSAQGLDFFAVSDLNADELHDFVDKFEALSVRPTELNDTIDRSLANAGQSGSPACDGAIHHAARRGDGCVAGCFFKLC
jgi:hypothetical protein